MIVKEYILSVAQFDDNSKSYMVIDQANNKVLLHTMNYDEVVEKFINHE